MKLTFKKKTLRIALAVLAAIIILGVILKTTRDKMDEPTKVMLKTTKGDVVIELAQICR